MDYNKMKVNDLKAELAARNLDTKGVKLVLVERLKEAIEKESTGNAAESTPTVTGTKKIETGTPNQSTPVRRSRRRSMTRSPSPTKVETSVLESVSEAPEETDDSESTRKKRRTRSITKSPSPAKVGEVKRLEAVEEETDSVEKQETTSKHQTDPLTPDKQNNKPEKPTALDKQISSPETTLLKKGPSEITTPQASSPVKHADATAQKTPSPVKSGNNLDSTPKKANSVSVTPSNITTAPLTESPISKSPIKAETPTKISHETTSVHSVETSASTEPSLTTSEKSAALVESANDTQPETKSDTSPDEVCLTTEEEKEDESSKVAKRKSTSPGKDSPAKAPRTKYFHTSIDFENTEIEPAFDGNETFTLSWYDSHLNLEIDNLTCTKGTPLKEGALGLLWAGARANFGVVNGKGAFEVLLTSTNETYKNTDETITNEFRVGWSIDESNLLLGEDKLSFAYCSTGTKATECKFDGYGVEYKSNDVVGVYIDLDSNPCKIEYTVNNINQGVAFEFQKNDLNGKALFPHICSKNIAFTVNFGQLERSLLNKDPEKIPVISSDKVEDDVANTNTKLPDTPENKSETEQSTPNKENKEDKETKEENTVKCLQKELCINTDYTYVAKLSKENLVKGISSPTSRENCEVIFLIGLPCSGKTHWVQNYLKENPEKKYTVLNTEALLDQMTVLGEPRQPSNTTNWSRLIEALARSLNHLNEVAKTRRRNVIIDQTNAFFSEQKRRVRGFGGFAIRKAVVVVPEEEEYNRRFKSKTDEFKLEIQENNIINMKANIYIPVLEHGWFTEITFAELDEEKTREAIKKLNEDNRKLLKSNKNKGQRRGTNDKQQWNQGNRYSNQQYQQRYNTQQRYNNVQHRNYRPGGGYGRNDGNHYGGNNRYRNQNDWMRNSGRYQNRNYQGTGIRHYDGNRNDYRQSRGYSGGWSQQNTNCWSYGSYQGNDNEEFNTWWQSNIKNLLQQHGTSGADNSAQHASMERYWSQYAQQHNYGSSGSSSRNK